MLEVVSQDFFPMRKYHTISSINSLLAHVDELRVYISVSKVDVLAINEIKLDSTIENSEIHLPGYEIIGKDRQANGQIGGGACTACVLISVI